MPKLIGTAGHVDHGKTTLIQALTGIDADRLPEEKARGMTIDIGFAFMDLPDVGRVSIVDVPGHERFITNMLVGALGIDLALLCVAADEGVKPQTREHLQILRLLPVKKMVVAITRSDLVDADGIELAKMEVADLLRGSQFASAPIIAVSAQSGAGMDELRKALSSSLQSESSVKPLGAWYLPIDRVFSVKGHGCVVTGTLARGSVEVGSSAMIVPGDREVRIRSIHSHDQEILKGEPGMRIALNVGGVKAEELRRGLAIGAPGSVFETNCIDARIKWIGKVKHAEKVRVSIGSAEVIGKVFIDKDEPERTQLRLQESCPAALNQPVIVRRHSPPDLLGGGTVETPIAVPKRRTNSVQVSNLAAALLEVVAAHPTGVETGEVCRQLGRSPQELGDHFERLSREQAIIGFAGTWLSKSAWQSCAQRIEQALTQLHERSPMVPWQPRDIVMKAAGLPWAGKPLDRAISLLASEGKIEAQGTGIQLPTFSLKLTDRQRQFLDRVKVDLEAAGFTTPNAFDLSKNLHVPMPAVEEILKLGHLAGEIVQMEGGVAYTTGQISQLKDSLRKAADGKPFTAGQARDALNVSRKYIIPLLEHMDKIQFTMRMGDQRVIR